jgi:hypothetical protein
MLLVVEDLISALRFSAALSSCPLVLKQAIQQFVPNDIENNSTSLLPENVSKLIEAARREDVRRLREDSDMEKVSAIVLTISVALEQAIYMKKQLQHGE